MVALTQHLVQGLVLSLSLSSSLFLMSNAQTTSAAPKSTATIAPTGTTAATSTPTTTSTAGAPSAFLGVASASNANFIFYQGGQLNTATVAYSNELYSLDLTKSWPISNPAWANLTAPASGTLTGPTVGQHSATMSKDETSLLVTAPTGSGSLFLYEYNTSARSWSTVNAPPAQAAVWANRKAANFVTDPSTGASWFFGGSFPDGSSTNEIDMFQNGAWTAAITATAAAGTSLTALNNFSSGTSHLYGTKIYVFGGFSSTSGQRGYQSFQNLPWIDVSTSSPTYGNQLTLGAVPPPRQNHCSVLTDSQKVIIFGGYDANAVVTFQDIWSLDMVTLTWSQIVTTNPTRPRYGHTCNIAGANMVVFGGAATSSNSSVGYAKDTQVYDVMLATWMSSYAPKQDTTAISKPLPGGANSSNGFSVGAIIGVVAGALVIVGVIFGLILYRRRQKQIEIHEAQLEKEAYLASLRPEGSDPFGGSKMGHSPRSPASAHVVGTPMMSTPGMSHNGAYNGMDELLLSNAAASPAMGQGQGNVQYLMQHLPDGTIAVQPVYLDHQSMQLQSSSNLIDGGDYGSPSGETSPGRYFGPPPPNGAPSTYVLPPTMQQQTPQVSYPRPSHDPFASPAPNNAPLPPGYSTSLSGRLQ